MTTLYQELDAYNEAEANVIRTASVERCANNEHDDAFDIKELAPIVEGFIYENFDLMAHNTSI